MPKKTKSDEEEIQNDAPALAVVPAHAVGDVRYYTHTTGAVKRVRVDLEREDGTFDVTALDENSWYPSVDATLLSIEKPKS